MTQNTIENKAKFFLLYVGSPYVNKNGVKGNISLYAFPIEMSEASSILQLRSLSDMTREELIELAKVYRSNVRGLARGEASVPDKEWLRAGKETRDLLFDGSIEILSVSALLRAIDFLRSRGFLLPYLDLSIEQILEYGWAVIKS